MSLGSVFLQNRGYKLGNRVPLCLLQGLAPDKVLSSFEPQEGFLPLPSLAACPSMIRIR